MSIETGVASSDAGVGASLAAPAEQVSTNTEVSNPESTSQNNASVVTGSETKTEFSPNDFLEKLGSNQPSESVGIKNLREHVKNLEKDLSTHKGVSSRISDLGGLESIEGLVNNHNTFAGMSPRNFREDGVYDVLQGWYDTNPANFTIMVETIAAQYPDIVKNVLSKTDKDYQSLLNFKKESDENAKLLDDDLDVPTEDLMQNHPVQGDAYKWRKYQEEQRQAEQQRQAEAAKANSPFVVQENIKQEITNTLFSDGIKQVESLQKTSGVSPEQAEGLYKEMVVRLELDPKFKQSMEGIVNSKQFGGKPPLGAEGYIRKTFNETAAHVINQFTQQNRIATQSKQTQARTQINSNVAGIILPNKDAIDLNNPDQMKSVVAQFEKVYSKPRV